LGNYGKEEYEPSSDSLILPCVLGKPWAKLDPVSFIASEDSFIWKHWLALTKEGRNGRRKEWRHLE
jgi:hypothetical protein